jgi:hypothetical protein
MTFFSISNDYEIWNRHRSQSCKRRKIQDSHLSTETLCNVREELKYIHADRRLITMNAELNKPPLQILMRQLLCDLHAFIMHAKQLFNDNYDPSRAQSSTDSATSLNEKQMEFVSHAIVAYLDHFAPSEAILELLKTSAQIFKNSFQQTAASTKQYSSKISSTPQANSQSAMSPMSWTTDTFSKMELENDLHYFQPTLI